VELRPYSLGPSPLLSLNASSSSSAFRSRFLLALSVFPVSVFTDFACAATLASEGSTTSTTLDDGPDDGAGTGETASASSGTKEATVLSFFFFLGSPEGPAEGVDEEALGVMDETFDEDDEAEAAATLEFSAVDCFLGGGLAKMSSIEVPAEAAGILPPDLLDAADFLAILTTTVRVNEFVTETKE
jgi:hypothetical protein